METASISTRYSGMMGASIALLKDMEYAFSEAGMDLHCAFRLRAALLWQQQVRAEGPVIRFRYHLGKSCIPRENVAEKIVAPFSSLWACGTWLSYSWEATTPCSTRWAVQGFRWIAERPLPMRAVSFG